MHTKHEGKSIPVDAMKRGREEVTDHSFLTLALVAASGQILIPATLRPLVLWWHIPHIL
jgi:hypothetical protein